MASYDKYVPYAIQMERDTGIPAAIILGQAMLEGGASLSSGLIKQANNFFGIKGVGNAGSVYMPTREEINGKSITVNGKFRKYNTPYDSFMDHAKLLQNPRYQKHLTSAKTLSDWASGIKAGGYATDAKYVSKLMNVITSNGLDKIGSVPVGSYAANLGKTPAGGSDALGALDVGYKEDLKETASDVARGITKIVVLLVLFIVGILFFINAMPVERIASDAVNQASKVVKPVRAAKKLLKKVK
jgi:flagellar protein FlgJ